MVKENDDNIQDLFTELIASLKILTDNTMIEIYDREFPKELKIKNRLN